MTDEVWLDTVRIARDLGDAEQLFPPGVANLRDLPHLWFDAIRMAMVFLGFEELPKEERPPKRIWLNTEELGAWFARVEREREQKYGKDGPGPIDDPVENPVARGLIVG